MYYRNLVFIKLITILFFTNNVIFNNAFAVKVETSQDACKDLLNGNRYDYNSSGKVIAEHFCLVSDSGILKKVTKLLTKGAIPTPIIDWSPIKPISVENTPIPSSGSETHIQLKTPISLGVKIGTPSLIPIDPKTKEPFVHVVEGKPVLPIDPGTGKPVFPTDPISRKPVVPLNSETGKPIFPIDPVTGIPIRKPIDPKTNERIPIPTAVKIPTIPIDTKTGNPDYPIDPATGKPTAPINPVTGKPMIPMKPGTRIPLLPVNPETGIPYYPIDPVTKKPVLPTNPITQGPYIQNDANTGKPILPINEKGKPYIPVNSKNGKPILPINVETGKPFIPYDNNHKAVLPLNKNKKPFIPYYQGEAILPINKKGHAVIPFDSTGKEILPISEYNGKKYIPIDKKSKRPILPIKNNKKYIPLDENGKAILPIDSSTGKPFIPVDPVSKKPILPIDSKTGKAYKPIAPYTGKPYPEKEISGNDDNHITGRLKPGLTIARATTKGFGGFVSIVIDDNSGCDQSDDRPCIIVKPSTASESHSLQQSAASFKLPHNLGDLFSNNTVLPKGLQLYIPSESSVGIGVGQVLGVFGIGAGADRKEKSVVSIERKSGNILTFSFIKEKGQDFNGLGGLLFIRADQEKRMKSIQGFDYNVDLLKLTPRDRKIISEINPRKLLKGDKETLKLFKDIMKRNGIYPIEVKKTAEQSTLRVGPIIGKDNIYGQEIQRIVTKDKDGKVTGEVLGISLVEGIGEDKDNGSARKTSFLTLKTTGNQSVTCPSLQIESTLPTKGRRIQSYLKVIQKYWGDSIDQSLIETGNHCAINYNLAYKFDCNANDMYKMKSDLGNDGSWKKIKSQTCNTIANYFSKEKTKALSAYCQNPSDDPSKFADDLSKLVKKKKLSYIALEWCQNKSFYDRQASKTNNSCLKNKSKEIFGVLVSMRKATVNSKSDKELFKSYNKSLSSLDFLLFKKMVTPHWCRGSAWVKVDTKAK